MKPKNKRLLTLIAFVTMTSLGFIILLVSLRENLIFFFIPPTEVFEKTFDSNKKDSSWRYGKEEKCGKKKLKKLMEEN